MFLKIVVGLWNRLRGHNAAEAKAEVGNSPTPHGAEDWDCSGVPDQLLAALVSGITLTASLSGEGNYELYTSTPSYEGEIGAKLSFVVQDKGDGLVVSVIGMSNVVAIKCERCVGDPRCPECCGFNFVWKEVPIE